MRIAMLAPISWRTPPRHYGPWELVTSLLTEALVARGVDVTLFATLDSSTAGTLAGVCPRPYSEDPTIDAKVWELLHVAHVFERAAEFDLIHNQADFVPLAFSNLVAAGDEPEVFNGFCGAESGSVPVSAVAPSVLFSNLEFQLKEKGQDRPPLLPKPLPEDDGAAEVSE